MISKRVQQSWCKGVKHFLINDKTHSLLFWIIVKRSSFEFWVIKSWFQKEFCRADATRSNVLLNKEKNALIRVIRHEPLVQKTGRLTCHVRQLFFLFFSIASSERFWIAPPDKILKHLRSFLPLKSNGASGQRCLYYSSIGRLSIVFEVDSQRAKTSRTWFRLHCLDFRKNKFDTSAQP